jgi:glycosyltransferase involved in cell wall biosynthesis
VVYNFVDFSHFDRQLDGASLRREFQIPAGRRVVLYCGGTNPMKGGNIVPAALARLKELFPNFVCIVSGYMTPPGLSQARTARMLNDADSPLAQSYDAFRRLEREGFAMVTGFRTDIEKLLAASDCLIFPSIVAHFARPVLEAACMAKPVVASRFRELEEVVADGKTGILVRPNDAEALATALARLLADDDRMKEMGEAAYQEAIRLFDVRTNIQQILDVYEEVLGEHFKRN